MKNLWFILLVFSVLTFVTGCWLNKNFYGWVLDWNTNSDMESKLRIKKTCWSGRPMIVSDDVITELNIKLGWEYEEMWWFIISDVNKNNIVIKTQQPLSDWNSILTGETEFVVSKNRELKLKTLTMDTGCTYYLKLVN